MRTALTLRILGLLAGATLSGCAATQPGPAVPAPQPPASCQAAGAEAAIGQVATASVVEDARQRAGARSARVLRPGQVVTLEFDGSRLNLLVDADSRVTSVRCG